MKKITQQIHESREYHHIVNYSFDALIKGSYFLQSDRKNSLLKSWGGNPGNASPYLNQPLFPILICHLLYVLSYYYLYFSVFDQS